MSFTNEQLDTVLRHMASNSNDEPKRPDLICNKAGLDLQKDTAYLLLNKLYLDGYVTKGHTGGAIYTINGNGVTFINNDGYAGSERRLRYSRNWKIIQNAILAITAVATLLVSIKQCAITDKTNELQRQIDSLNKK